MPEKEQVAEAAEVVEFVADVTAEVAGHDRRREVAADYQGPGLKVKDIAILREMELRAGMPFDLASFERDQRYIGDLGVFSSVVITVDPLGDDMCSMRITVTERPTLLLKLIYPILEYDFNSERIRYGVKWNDRNFRKRLETVSVDVQRDNFNNDRAAIQWSTRWVGWKQIGTFR